MAKVEYSRSQDFRISQLMSEGKKIDYSDGEQLGFWEAMAEAKRAENRGDLQKSINIMNRYWEKKCGYSREYWGAEPEKT
jgi:hypothetical protein